ncbi:MAG TPA: serine/threonine-protein kinase, partial [Xanthomonadales bacterium]|nr:serine/threonine-protein kinase [Xanthomonadales bacterium]
GVYNGFHYCTMEYLPGGPVMKRGAPPLALKPALRCVREIALALHYAQEKGFIHRDVKPDNILLREDGSCVLGDFGIARAADSGTLMTKTGSVVGTPHYMSPEQLRGRAIDGRADLYSLGVVFFQLVTGKVPYEASDSLAIGIMHMTAPLPQLPAEYRMLQPILDKMLAKEPGDRYQTGAEIDAALAEVERQISAGTANTPPPVIPAQTRPMPPLRAERKSGYDPQGTIRTEPQLGRMEGVDDESIRAEPRHTQFTRAHQAAPSSRGGIWWVFLAVVCVAGLAFWQRPLISSWMQSTSTPASDLDRADAALAAGRLDGNEGSDALSLYASALTLDSENTRARNGLTQTLDQLYASAASVQPADRTRIEAIARRLTGVRGFDGQSARFQALLPPVDSVAQTPPVAPDKSPVDPIAADMAAAQNAEAQGRLDGPSGALARFAAAHSLDAANEQAREGVERVATAVAGQARSHLAGGDLATAERLQRELAVVPAAAATATALGAEIQKRRQALDQNSKIPNLLAEAARLAQQGRLLEPANASAADRYVAVLAIDGKNADAASGLARVTAAAIPQIDAAIVAKDFDRARRLLQRVQKLAPGTRGLTDARERLDDAVAASRGPTPDQQAALDRLIAEGETALGSEQFLEPPGDSAYDKFRSALAINPRSEQARSGMQAIAQALRLRINQSLVAGRATRADSDLAALEMVDPRYTDGPELKRRIAKAYAENGLRSLERGAVEQARQDLEAAERLDASESTVASLRAALSGR